MSLKREKSDHFERATFNYLIILLQVTGNQVEIHTTCHNPTIFFNENDTFGAEFEPEKLFNKVYLPPNSEVFFENFNFIYEKLEIVRSCLPLHRTTKLFTCYLELNWSSKMVMVF